MQAIRECCEGVLLTYMQNLQMDKARLSFLSTVACDEDAMDESD